MISLSAPPCQNPGITVSSRQLSILRNAPLVNCGEAHPLSAAADGAEADASPRLKLQSRHAHLCPAAGTANRWSAAVSGVDFTVVCDGISVVGSSCHEAVESGNGQPVPSFTKGGVFLA